MRLDLFDLELQVGRDVDHLELLKAVDMEGRSDGHGYLALLLVVGDGEGRVGHHDAHVAEGSEEDTALLFELFLGSFH